LKLKFGGGKARTEFGQKPRFGGKARRHNRFGFKANPATTNCVFGAKILQINVVQIARFFYNFYMLVRTSKTRLAQPIYADRF
jgi:hypothetical protein